MSTFGREPTIRRLAADYRALLAEGLPDATDEQLDAAAILLATSADQDLRGRRDPAQLERDIYELQRIFGTLPGGGPRPAPAH
jgi:hypothetical protein